MNRASPKPDALITGGAGFIGTRLARDLVGRGYRVLLVDCLHPQVHPRGVRLELASDAEFFPFDVTVPSNWDALMRVASPTTVVHLAAETGTGQSLLESTRHATVNVVGTAVMLDAFARNHFRPDHLVLASSRAVYGEGEWIADGVTYRPLARSHEDLAAGRFDPRGPNGEIGEPLPHRAGVTPPAPTSVYGATKLAQEHVMRAWSNAMGSRLSVLRLQNVYGEGQSLTNPYTGVLSLFATRAARGEVIEVYEDGKIVRDFVHVRDVVTAIAAAITHPPVTTRLVDVGSGSATTIGDVATTLASMAGAPGPETTGRFRDGDVRAAWCDPSAASEDLGIGSKVSLDTGLESLLAWVRDRSAG